MKWFPVPSGSHQFPELQFPVPASYRREPKREPEPEESSRNQCFEVLNRRGARSALVGFGGTSPTIHARRVVASNASIASKSANPRTPLADSDSDAHLARTNSTSSPIDLADCRPGTAPERITTSCSTGGR